MPRTYLHHRSPSRAPAPRRGGTTSTTWYRCPQHPFQPPHQFLPFLFEESLEPGREFDPIDRPFGQLHADALRSQAGVAMSLPVVFAVRALWIAWAIREHVRKALVHLGKAECDGGRGGGDGGILMR